MISKRELIVAGFALAMPEVSWAQDVITVPLRRKNGCLTVEVKINDQGPFTFLVNLGGGFASIPTELSNRLRLQLIGDGLEPYVIIVGAQAYPAFRVNAANVVFGKELVRKNVVFMRVPTQALKDSEFDGIVGSGLVLAKPSILDMDAGEIRVYSNGQLPLEGFREVPASVKRSGVNTSSVAVECRFAGQTAMLGASMNRQAGVYLTSSYVKANNLWDRFPNYTVRESPQDNSPNDMWERFHDFVPQIKNPERENWRVVRLKDFSIGAFSFDDIDLWLCNPAAEDISDEAVGFVGSDILSRFTIAFGVKNQVWFRPAASFNGKIA